MRQVAFSESAREWLHHPDLRVHARFIEGEPDYLRHNAAYDLQK